MRCYSQPVVLTITVIVRDVLLLRGERGIEEETRRGKENRVQEWMRAPPSPSLLSLMPAKTRGKLLNRHLAPQTPINPAAESSLSSFSIYKPPHASLSHFIGDFSSERVSAGAAIQHSILNPLHGHKQVLLHKREERFRHKKKGKILQLVFGQTNINRKSFGGIKFSSSSSP